MLVLRNDKAEKQGVIVRLARNVLQRAPEFLSATEPGWFQPESDWLGFWLGIRSTRADQVFEDIHRNICHGFSPHLPQVINGVVWVRFGF